jgi:hypothetical protein
MFSAEHEIFGLLPLYTCGIIFFTFVYLIFTYIGPFVSLYICISMLAYLILIARH